MTEIKKHGGVRIPVNEVALVPKIAALLALGKSTTSIAETLGIGFGTVKKLAGKEETRDIVKEIAEGYKDVAKAFCMKEITEMNDLSMEGLRKALKDGNVQAIRTHLQVVGLIGAEETANKNQGNGSLTVVLPGATVTQNEVIDVTERETQLDVEPGDEGSQDL